MVCVFVSPPSLLSNPRLITAHVRLEAVWLLFPQSATALPRGKTGPALKISQAVEGQLHALCWTVKLAYFILGALSGVSTSSTEPPKFGAEQHYVVVGQQPLFDRIVSGQGVVRQVRKLLHIKGIV